MFWVELNSLGVMQLTVVRRRWSSSMESVSGGGHVALHPCEIASRHEIYSICFFSLVQYSSASVSTFPSNAMLLQYAFRLLDLRSYEFSDLVRKVIRPSSSRVLVSGRLRTQPELRN